MAVPAFVVPLDLDQAVDTIRTRQAQSTAEKVAHRLTKAELRRLQHDLDKLRAEHLEMLALHEAEKKAMQERLSASEARANKLETEARLHAREMARLNQKVSGLELDMEHARADMEDGENTPDPRLEMLQRQLEEQAAILKAQYQSQIDDLVRQLRDALNGSRGGKEAAAAQHALELADMEARCTAIASELKAQLADLLAAREKDKAEWEQAMSELQARVAQLESELAAEKQKVADGALQLEALKQAHAKELGEVRDALAKESALRANLQKACEGLMSTNAAPKEAPLVGQSYLSQGIFVARKKFIQ